jgi:hypothetical protein
MLDQIQVPQMQKVTDPHMPIPQYFPFGHVIITVDHEKFIAAIGYGMIAYFEADDDEKTQMSAQELLHDLKEILSDDDDDHTTPLSWRIGFLVGEIAGFLNPDLKEDDPSLSYLESLARKCQRLYC